MFESSPEFASDLDWMLQSGQASQALILEALVEEYYRDAYLLALSILDDQAAARSATRETFEAALLDIHNYRGQVGVHTWFYRIALGACRRELTRLQARRAVKALLPLPRKPGDFGLSTPETELDAALWLAIDALDENSRLAVLLYDAHNWGPAEISAMLGIEDDDLLAGLHKSQAMLEAALGDLEHPSDGEARLEDMDAILRRSLERRWHGQAPSQGDIERDIPSILRRASRKGARRQGVSHLKELIAIAAVILVAVSSIWGMNYLWPEPTPTPKIATVVITRIVGGGSSLAPAPFNQPTPTAPGTPTRTAVPRDAFYVVQPGDSLYSVARLLNTSVEELVELNRIPAGASLSVRQRLLIPGRLPQSPARIATPVPPLPKVAPLKDPLTSEDILHRIQLAGLLFHTAWLDAQIIDYGPLGYVGPPRAQRAQVWIGQEQFLALVGSGENSVHLALLHDGGRLYLARPAQNQPWFFEWEFEAAEQDTMLGGLAQLLDTIGYRRPVSAEANLEAAGRESLAGRQTLVVDELETSGERKARFWLDDRTGLVLRRVSFSDDGSGTPLREINVTAIVYDVDLPQALFDTRLPWRGGFAQDPSGGPIPPQAPPWPEPQGRERLPYQEPPASFDPSQSRLTFQHKQEIGFAPGMVMDLFADGYLLKTATFGDPWTMICERSRDGERIAYVSKPSDDVFSEDPYLHWFGLKETFYHDPLQELAVTQFAFAPDSLRLALFGRKSIGQMGSLIVLDTETGQKRALLTLGDARSLVWSPDGERLALIARYRNASFEEHVVVVNTDTGIIEYSAPLDFNRYPASEWPTASWGVAFPAEMGGLEACAAPPP